MANLRAAHAERLLSMTVADDRPRRPCPSCGKPILAVAAICRYCHHEVRGVAEILPGDVRPRRPCPACGELVLEDASVCRYCNVGIPRAASTQRQEDIATTTRGIGGRRTDPWETAAARSDRRARIAIGVLVSAVAVVIVVKFAGPTIVRQVGRVDSRAQAPVASSTSLAPSPVGPVLLEEEEVEGREELDGVWVFRPLTIRSITDTNVHTLRREHAFLHLIAFGAFSEAKDLKFNVTVDFSATDTRVYENFLIKLMAHGTLDDHDLIAFSKERRLACLGSRQGEYSLGSYHISITLTAIGPAIVRANVLVNDRSVCEKVLDLGVYIGRIWGVAIGGAMETADIKRFHLSTQREEFIRRGRGVIRK